MLACFTFGLAGGIANVAELADFGPPLAVAVGYFVYARLERNMALGVVALSLAALTVALAAAQVTNAGQRLALVYGASLVILGLVARTAKPSPR